MPGVVPVVQFVANRFKAAISTTAIPNLRAVTLKSGRVFWCSSDPPPSKRHSPADDCLGRCAPAVPNIRLRSVRSGMCPGSRATGILRDKPMPKRPDSRIRRKCLDFNQSRGQFAPQIPDHRSARRDNRIAGLDVAVEHGEAPRARRCCRRSARPRQWTSTQTPGAAARLRLSRQRACCRRGSSGPSPGRGMRRRVLHPSGGRGRCRRLAKRPASRCDRAGSRRRAAPRAGRKMTGA